MYTNAEIKNGTFPIHQILKSPEKHNKAFLRKVELTVEQNKNDMKKLRSE